MSVILFAENLLESAASITASAPADAAFLGRLYDRERGAQYQGGPTQEIGIALPLLLSMKLPSSLTITVDLGSSKAVTGWALVNTNITGVTVTLKADDSNPPTTSRDSVDPAATDTLRTFAAVTKRYWSLTIPAMAAASPMIGEFLLGNPRTITENPLFANPAREVMVNVRRDRSPAGYDAAVKRGSRRVALPYGWSAITDANRVTLEAALDELSDSAKKLLVQDPLGVLRWMTWVLPDDRLVFTPSTRDSNGLCWAVSTRFEEAL